MTTQEAYRQIREYFSRPGAVIAWDSDVDQCSYRVGSNPKSPERCAVGCLIPDEEYDARFEAMPMLEVREEVRALWEVDSDFLYAAQTAHDSVATVSEFLPSLDALALQYELTL